MNDGFLHQIDPWFEVFSSFGTFLAILSSAPYIASTPISLSSPPRTLNTHIKFFDDVPHVCLIVLFFSLSASVQVFSIDLSSVLLLLFPACNYTHPMDS